MLVFSIGTSLIFDELSKTEQLKSIDGVIAPTRGVDQRGASGGKRCLVVCACYWRVVLDN